jgi:hypothetical protein
MWAVGYLQLVFFNLVQKTLVPLLANSNSCTMDFSSVDIQFLLYWKSVAVLTNLRNVSFLARHHADTIHFTEAIPNFL